MRVLLANSIKFGLLQILPHASHHRVESIGSMKVFQWKLGGETALKYLIVFYNAIITL